MLVHIDVDPAEIGKNVGPTIPLVGDARHIFEDFNKETFTCEHEEWIGTLDAYRSTMARVRKPDPAYVDPAEFIRMLSEAMEEDAVYVDRYFADNVYPVLTPMAVDSSRPFPLIRNKSLNLGALMKKKNGEDEIEFAMVQVPSVLSRIVTIPGGKETRVILLEIGRAHV